MDLTSIKEKLLAFKTQKTSIKSLTKNENKENIKEKDQSQNINLNLNENTQQEKPNIENLENEVKRRIKEIELKIAPSLPTTQEVTFDVKEYYEKLEKQLAKERREGLQKQFGEKIENIIKSNDDNFIREVSYDNKCKEILIWITKAMVFVKENIKNDMYIDTKNSIKPLLLLLSNKQAPKQVVEKLFDTMIYCLNKDYEKAINRYYELAIGNSPWPKGETKFTIHDKYIDRIRTDNDIAFI